MNSLTSQKHALQRAGAAAPVARSVALFLVSVAACTIGIPGVIPLAGSVFHRQPVASSPADSITATLRGTFHDFRGAEGPFGTGVLAANRRWMQGVAELESQLEDVGLLTVSARNGLRTLLVKMGKRRVGDVEAGHSNTLFFHPDIRHLTGPGFLTEGFLQRRSQETGRNGMAVQPDSRAAILNFHQQLQQRGIRLIVVPTPCKAAIHPEQLSVQRAPTPRALRNSSMEEWKQELSAAGVWIFDPADVLMEEKLKNASVSLYLRTDTHWTPESMLWVAKKLSEAVKSELSTSELSVMPPGRSEFTREPQELTNAGDLAIMLQLSGTDELVQPEQVVIQKVRQEHDLVQQRGIGQQPKLSPPILILGDSFTNIYSAVEMQWGTNAGFAEQLSVELQVAVDSLAVNGGGATESRRSLIREIAAGRAGLEGRKVVIWQFAERDLSEGDWPLLEIPATGRRMPVDIRRPEAVSEAEDVQWISGRVRAVTAIPNVAGLPYPDAVICMHLESVASEGQQQTGSQSSNGEVLVYSWGLRNRKRVTAPAFVAGDRVQIRVQSWDQVRSQYERFYRVELEDPYFQLAELPIFWMETAVK